MYAITAVGEASSWCWQTAKSLHSKVNAYARSFFRAQPGLHAVGIVLTAAAVVAAGTAEVVPDTGFGECFFRTVQACSTLIYTAVDVHILRQRDAAASVKRVVKALEGPVEADAIYKRALRAEILGVCVVGAGAMCVHACRSSCSVAAPQIERAQTVWAEVPESTLPFFPPTTLSDLLQIFNSSGSFGMSFFNATAQCLETMPRIADMLSAVELVKRASFNCFVEGQLAAAESCGVSPLCSGLSIAAAAHHCMRIGCYPEGSPRFVRG